ncbi:AAA family ATPase [Streptomyces erythrochromogenes]|uniref:AAA family ATPase n=1 Tax=Streptomyces erythrochromogenes TaxID=285574 RepID=UPI00370028DD
MTIRIGIIGTHSTGKTTLLQRIEMELRAQGHKVARTPGRLAVRAAELGFPKLKNHTARSTEWIMASGIAAELETGLIADIVLVDRAIPDALAYYLAALDERGEEGDPNELAHLHALTDLHAKSYDLLFATVLDPEVPMGDHRDQDAGYRAAVNRHIHKIAAGIPHHVVANTDTDRDAAITTALTLASKVAG